MASLPPLAAAPNGSTHYDVLEVSRFATHEEIRASYKRLALRYHPDKNREEEAHLRFIAVSEAYSVLKDSAARSAYDATLHDADADEETKNGLDDDYLFDEEERRQRQQQEQQQGRRGSDSRKSPYANAAFFHAAGERFDREPAAASSATATSTEPYSTFSQPKKTSASGSRASPDRFSRPPPRFVVSVASNSGVGGAAAGAGNPMSSDALLRAITTGKPHLVLSPAALRDRLAQWKELWRQEVEADERARGQEDRARLAALNAASELRLGGVMGKRSALDVCRDLRVMRLLPDDEALRPAAAQLQRQRVTSGQAAAALQRFHPPQPQPQPHGRPAGAGTGASNTSDNARDGGFMVVGRMRIPVSAHVNAGAPKPAPPGHEQREAEQKQHEELRRPLHAHAHMDEPRWREDRVLTRAYNDMDGSSDGAASASPALLPSQPSADDAFARLYAAALERQRQRQRQSQSELASASAAPSAGSSGSGPGPGSGSGSGSGFAPAASSAPWSTNKFNSHKNSTALSLAPQPAASPASGSALVASRAPQVDAPVSVSLPAAAQRLLTDGETFVVRGRPRPAATEAAAAGSGAGAGRQARAPSSSAAASASLSSPAGKPLRVALWVSSDLSRVLWRSAASASAQPDGALAVDALVRVSAAAAPSPAGAGAGGGTALLRLVTLEQTLTLEAAGPALRDEWVAALRLLLAHHDQRQRRQP